jgi:2-polyprenyl-3-methyl-5-hydroxy-6-metoxy-1,4-benzoquinol methylase
VDDAELIAMLREVRERVRERNPEGAPSGIALPDLAPLARARDEAMGKAASIGTVNPRRGGPLNALAQAVKRLTARALDWHVREQVIFNRKALACIDAAIEALAENNRALARLSDFAKTNEELKDVRAHWAAWRVEWEEKLARNEAQFLRSVADLQAGYQHRADLLDASYRDTARGQHAEFTAALERAGAVIQSEMRQAMQQIKLDYERMIHSELRLIRLRAATMGQAVPPANAGQVAEACPASAPALDFARFAERFRGPEETVKSAQRAYVSRFAGKRAVLDIGCGRGEFLELMREAGVPARGIDTGAECVAMCRGKGLHAEAADLFEHLRAIPEESLDGIFCAHVIEHLPPARLPEMIALCCSRLMKGGAIAIESPDPACLAIFATYFYLDPTHVRPVPRQLLEFYLNESGVGVVEFRSLAPAAEAVPAVNTLPPDFREAFFGGLDYALVGEKL